MSASTASAAGTFDYVIVGAGSSGSVIASRLTENPNTTVLLLEAGGENTGQEVTIPAAFSKTFKSKFDWNYETTPQPELGGRTIYWPRGKVLGGCSSINAMMWVPGFPSDYEEWGRLAGDAWGWGEFQRLLAKSEVVVNPQRDPREWTEHFLQASEQAGIKAGGNTLTQSPDGMVETLVTQDKGARSSTATAYLTAEVRKRPNLEIRTDAHVTRVVFDDPSRSLSERSETKSLRQPVAIGVEYLQNGKLFFAAAAKESVLSGGAVNTPQILMLSGIGDPAELAKHGIDVVASAPEVGKNMRDHLVCLYGVSVDGGTLKTAESLPQIFKYLTKRTGMLTSNIAEAYGYVRTSPELAEPDIELIFAPVAFVQEGLVDPPEEAIGCGTVLQQPKSRGTISLRSANPLDKVIIEPGYLTDPEGADRAALLKGMEFCADILESPALRTLMNDRYVVPAGGENMSREERAEVALRDAAHTLYHPTSTARLGTDKKSVVDPELRVRGVSKLRVADASVFPEIMRGHTNAPAIVVGEKAAELLAAS